MSDTSMCLIHVSIYILSTRTQIYEGREIFVHFIFCFISGTYKSETELEFNKYLLMEFNNKI